MIKRTLYFGNPSYLSIQHRQLVVQLHDDEKTKKTIPVEDIGIVVLDHPQITLTQSVLKLLMENGSILINCDDSHLPHATMMPHSGHHLHTKHFAAQVEASLPLKKNLWQQTVIAKINNQAAVLEQLGQPSKRLEVLARNVLSGDIENAEGQAAAYYWKNFLPGFQRDPEGELPNALLNYGYAVLRAIVARSLNASGLHLALGIHHHNQYNAYCLADDIMEPFRPYVDILVHQQYSKDNLASFLTKEIKAELLSIATVDVQYGKSTSPLMVGLSQTTASLVECYLGTKRNLKYPTLAKIL